MAEPLRVVAGERSADELLSALEDGRRVIVETELAGTTHEVTLRYDGEVYYCDTPTTLHRHETAAEMRQCVRKRGYAATE